MLISILKHSFNFRGDEFRRDFRKLGDLTIMYPKAAHIALTATATPANIGIFTECLYYKTPEIIKVNPDRINIKYIIQERLPNIRKYEKLDNIMMPLIDQLKLGVKNFPLTIIYIENRESLGYCYRLLEDKVKIKCFAQFHKRYPESVKNEIIQDLRKKEPNLKLVLATVSLGMGLNAPSVRRIIHMRPPCSIENYVQESGRSGRDGQPAEAIMFYNNDDLGRKAVKPEIRSLCKSKNICIREQLVKHFGFDHILYEGSPNNCCSNCAYLKSMT